jgi:hypothetical protein
MSLLVLICNPLAQALHRLERSQRIPIRLLFPQLTNFIKKKERSYKGNFCVGALGQNTEGWGQLVSPPSDSLFCTGGN